MQNEKFKIKVSSLAGYNNFIFCNFQFAFKLDRGIDETEKSF